MSWVIAVLITLGLFALFGAFVYVTDKYEDLTMHVMIVLFAILVFAAVVGGVHDCVLLSRC